MAIAQHDGAVADARAPDRCFTVSTMIQSLLIRSDAIVSAM